MKVAEKWVENVMEVRRVNERMMVAIVSSVATDFGVGGTSAKKVQKLQYLPGPS